MTGQILSAYKQRIHSFKLIPSGGGCFELYLDGDLVYSKIKTGVFPNEDEMAALVGDRLSARV